MNGYLETAALGWLALLLFGANLWLPYLLGRAPARLKCMRPHYWIGYSLPGLALLHAWIPMSRGNMNGMNMTGLWLATIALLLLGMQVVLGLLLRNSVAGVRSTLQTGHFWTMAAAALLIVTHIALNRP